MQDSQQDWSEEDGELTSVLLGAGFALASLIILPALEQRVGIGSRSRLTIALRGALMRTAPEVIEHCFGPAKRLLGMDHAVMDLDRFARIMAFAL